MNDLISRQAAIDAVSEACFELRGVFGRCEDALKALPSVQPEHKKGKWIIEGINKYELSYGTTAYEPVYRCTACGRLTESYLRLDEPIMPEDADFPRFCPWCGAELEGTEDV